MVEPPLWRIFANQPTIPNVGEKTLKPSTSSCVTMMVGCYPLFITVIRYADIKKISIKAPIGELQWERIDPGWSTAPCPIPTLDPGLGSLPWRIESCTFLMRWKNIFWQSRKLWSLMLAYSHLWLPWISPYDCWTIPLMTALLTNVINDRPDQEQIENCANGGWTQGITTNIQHRDCGWFCWLTTWEALCE